MPKYKVTLHMPGGVTYSMPTALELYRFLVNENLIPTETFSAFQRFQNSSGGVEEDVLLFDNEIGTLRKEKKHE